LAKHTVKTARQIVVVINQFEERYFKKRGSLGASAVDGLEMLLVLGIMLRIFLYRYVVSGSQGSLLSWRIIHTYVAKGLLDLDHAIKVTGLIPHFQQIGILGELRSVHHICRAL
jgi:hypothetical protein